ncbi:unnamed protein product [Porites lobata]|uniref:Uncharacterized protein n=1 Tax=Porites lobata TaxID=104759 RepID=A0ABN8Q345_9CNID|nr:unnamed protein product [Porites lobata]
MPSAKKGVSVFNGRSYFPYIWLVFYGVSTGLVKGSACGVTTSLVVIINSKHSMSPQAIDLVQGPNKDQVRRDTAHWANKSSTKSPPSLIDIIYHPFHRLWAAKKAHQVENQDVEIYESTSVNGNHEASELGTHQSRFKKLTHLLWATPQNQRYQIKPRGTEYD